MGEDLGGPGGQYFCCLPIKVITSEFHPIRKMISASRRICSGENMFISIVCWHFPHINHYICIQNMIRDHLYGWKLHEEYFVDAPGLPELKFWWFFGEVLIETKSWPIDVVLQLTFPTCRQSQAISLLSSWKDTPSVLMHRYGTNALSKNLFWWNFSEMLMKMKNWPIDVAMQLTVRKVKCCGKGTWYDKMIKHHEKYMMKTYALCKRLKQWFNEFDI